MKTVFFISLIFIFYCYLGYPILIAALAKLFNRPVKKKSFVPKITVIISVYNEEDVIERKIKSLLDSDYPAKEMEILIGCDGCNDRTVEIIEKSKTKNMHLIINVHRRGKMQTLNALVKKAVGEILVFTDARQEIKEDAITHLVSNFNDRSIGCVSGELIFKEEDGATAKGINFYWRYEKYIRDQESRFHSMIGATGGIYAIRKELYADIPHEIVLDDVYVPLKVVEKGYRSIFDRNAIAYDEVSNSPREEHRRKARTLYGNFQIFRLFKNLFIPFRSPICLQIFSHKFLRVMMPLVLITIFLLNVLLAHEPIFLFILYLQCLFYLSACLGALAREAKYGILKILSKIGYIPYVFCLMNFSALVGLYRFLNSSQSVMWEKAGND